MSRTRDLRKLCALLVLLSLMLVNGAQAAQSLDGFNPNPPSAPVRLIFIHHSSGENWLADDNGGLGIALRDNNYVVSDTNYGWGPPDARAAAMHAAARRRPWSPRR